jgi:hypothetical protein
MKFGTARERSGAITQALKIGGYTTAGSLPGRPEGGSPRKARMSATRRHERPRSLTTQHSTSATTATVKTAPSPVDMALPIPWCAEDAIP